jgi:cell shape-determining protein MreD
MRTVNPKRPREPSFIRCLGAIGIGTAPLFLVFGLAAVFGADTIIFAGKRVYGWIALLDAIILNIVYAIVFAILQKFGFLLLDFFSGRRN